MGSEGGLLRQGDEKNAASAELKLVIPHGGSYATKPKRTTLKFWYYRSATVGNFSRNLSIVSFFKTVFWNAPRNAVFFFDISRER